MNSKINETSLTTKNSKLLLDKHIAKIPNFPKKGITFYDISPILESPRLLKQTIDALCEEATVFKPDLICGIDARGFLFATPLAYNLNCGVIMIRKSNKLPGKVLVQSYELEYGSAELSIQTERRLSGKRILVIDDLIATGGSLDAAQTLIKKASGIICGALCIIELTELKGREKLMCPIVSLQTYRF